MSRVIISLLLIFSMMSCATEHHTLSSLPNWSYPQNQFDSQMSFSYIDHVLEKTNNKSGARWATRKNIHVIGVRLVNTTNKPIHGAQLSFMVNGDEAEIIHNRWLAKKVRQRTSPLMFLFLPAFLIEAAIFNNNDTEDPYLSQYEPEYYITEELAKKADLKREKANFNLYRELMDFQLATKVLWPGKPVYGVIGIRSKHDLTNVKAVVSDIDYLLVK